MADPIRDKASRATTFEESQLEEDKLLLDEKKPLFNLVGIGASAGGLEALQTWFNHMPSDTGAAFVVIQHLSPDFKTMMDQLLEKFTKMPIIIVERMLKIEPNHIYIMSPGKNLVLDGMFLVASDKSVSERFNLPINELFHSMANNRQIRSIAVILSGTGSDGTLGVKSIYGNGGLVLIQDPDESQFNGMPMNAIATGVADLVGEVDVLATTLAAYLKAPENDGMTLSNRLEDHQDDMQKIYSLLLDETGVDFSFYKLSTISRRLEHRMGLNQVSRLGDYIELLKNDTTDELQQLKQVLLINVTQFFRDMASFEKLNKKVIEPLILAKKPNDIIRVWSIGCSTGEEPYSLAISFYEAIKKLKVKRNVKIFSTDVDEKTINTAMQGLYPESILTEVPDYYIRSHFRSDVSGMFRVREHIRHMVVFACHDVLKDPPFSNIDLITCRNMLIYFQPIGQKKAFKDIEFSLSNGGYLFLGKAEAPMPEYSNLDCVSYSDKIYKKNGKLTSNININHTLSASYDSQRSKILSRYKNTQRVTKRTDFSPINEVQSKNVLLLHITECLFDQNLPPTAILDVNHGIIKSYGSLTAWMKDLKPGEANTHIRDVFKPDVANYIVSAVEQALKEEKTVNYQGIIKGESTYTLSVSPLESHHPGFPVVLICRFIWESGNSLEVQDNAINIPIDNTVNERMGVIEKELQLTRNNLIVSQRELDTISAQLQTSNEELMASNEELQGTNEELQSVNEELHTLNSEYQQKINELTTVNNDLDNFMKSTGVAAIFLDRSYRIRRYTEPFSKYINILPVDIDRSFLDLKMAFQFDSVEASFNEVIKNGKSSTGRVKIAGDRHIIYKIIPYYGVKNNIDGVVVMINEDPEINAVMHDIQAVEKILALFYEKNQLINWEYDFNKKVFIFKENNLINMPLVVAKSDFYQCIPSADRSNFVENVESAINSGKDSELEHKLELTNQEVRHVHSMIFSSMNGSGDVKKVFGIIQDISDRKTHIQKNEYLFGKFQVIFELFPFPVTILSEDFIFQYANSAYCKFSGYSHEEIIGSHLSKVKPESDIETGIKNINSLMMGESDEISSLRKFLHKNNEISDVYIKSIKLPKSPDDKNSIVSILFPVDLPVSIDLGEQKLGLISEVIEET